jgi:class 3 adenylate cyclase
MAEEVVAFSEATFQNMGGILATMSSSMTAFSLGQGTQWPYYTHIDYEVFGQSVISTSGAKMVSWSPIVTGEVERDAWGEYSTENDAWVEEGLELRVANEGITMPAGPLDVPPKIYRRNPSGKSVVETGLGPFVPVWQMAAAPIDPSVVNFNLLSDDHFKTAFAAVKLTQNQVLSELVDASALYGSSAVADEEVPQSLLMAPVMKEYTDEISVIAGVVVAVLPWNLYFQGVLQEGSSSLYVVVSDGECGSEFTFEIKGPEVEFLGQGDLHDVQYSEYEVTSDFAASATANSQCSYSIHVYPSADLHKEFQDEQPFIWTIFIACIFVFMIVVFFVYDCFVETRQNKVLDSAAKSNAIVSALFPAEIRDRLFGNDIGPKSSTFFKNMPESSKYKLKNYLAEENVQTNNDEEAGKKKLFKAGTTEADVYDTKPIADLFPNTTVMFADIAGFTAWSSVREPSQVFTLLETVYHAFDVIAKRRRVFKVETVGDCYVAVTGLPEARKDHAVAMAKFARECLEKFNQLTKQLEITLGPDTGDLAMRAGLHSGPVTAGVLRGDKSRFQLFGDTVNTAAKIENLGQRNRVHLSSDTAELLRAGGKELWVTKRTGTVSYRGKGEMQTYWLQSPHDASNPVEEEKGDEPKNAHTLGDASIDELDASLSPKIQRLVHWNVEILKKLLQQIIAKKNAVGNRKNFEQQLTKMEADILRRKNCLAEVIQIIPLPKFDVKAHKNQETANKIEIPQKVVEQLRLFVSSVAAMHRDNPFHNFEHASHVTMSVSKLLSRIVAPDEVLNQEESENMASSLHDHTYGITSDPLTHFAVVVSALIHDTDHAGVSNFQLIQENHKMAKFFNKKSVAEQNSIVLAW